jgi:hypothetical protein
MEILVALATGQLLIFFPGVTKILRTRYREPVQYIGSLDLLYRTAIKLQKNESIWNKFYIKDVY